MTPAQSGKYFAEFGQLRDVLRAKGWSPTRIELHRHEITRKALGVDKSSKDFTNADLDKVFAVFSAERAPADFDAQMRLQDMPEKRVALLQARISALMLQIGLAPGRESGYVDGISNRMFGTQWHKLPERGLQQIEGILRRRLHQRPLTAEQIAAIEAEVAEHAAEAVA
jgi:hypothetical protein